ncbi:MAG: hypothetical protein V5A57_02680 [Candidatus Paceibacterota bacterium]
MVTALFIALGVNMWGAIMLYLPINYLISKSGIEEIKEVIRSRFPRLSYHWEKINGFNNSDSNFILFESPEKRNKTISKLVENYKYDYIALLVLSIPPVPFLGTILTGGAIFAVKTLEIRYGLFVIILGKIIKVFGVAAFAYFI